LFRSELLPGAIRGAVRKLNPVHLVYNPVMFVVEIGSVLTTIIAVQNAIRGLPFLLDLEISIWLWFTVLFANFAESLAESRSQAQADSLKRARSDAQAKRIRDGGVTELVPGIDLKLGDRVIIEEGDIVPGDGEIEKGVALIDESAITGESAPVVRESGGDRSAVTGGCRVLSGSITVRITANPGDTFIDQMIGMVEAATRQKTPNERALEILLIGLTGVFLAVVITMAVFSQYMAVVVTIPVLVSLLVCLMPTTIGGLLPAIGISGMDRLLQHNVIALSGRAVEAAGDVDVVLLDKTGTITLGNRVATEFIPAPGVAPEELVEASVLSSIADETPEGRSIMTLGKEALGVRGSDIRAPEGSTFIPFSVETRMSGISWDGRDIRKGTGDAVTSFVTSHGGCIPGEVGEAVNSIARVGGTPLIVADGPRVLGVVRLKDVLKQDIRDRLRLLHTMGITSVMVTGDNPLTAAAIAGEAGIDEFVAEARPETKLETIRSYQREGHLVAMIGDGTNDAPALAQADVAVAMNAGTEVAREAANMVDLDSNPTKLIDIVEIGKQILITRGALTTFSVANDVAKYFAIIPAIFQAAYPSMGILNIMNLATPESAVLSAVIFNAIVIPLLIPLSLRGVRYRPLSTAQLLRRNILIYGLGGLLLPFLGIKIIDWIVVVSHAGV
jgi:K+-transporting ATPase ATPase B chain